MQIGPSLRSTRASGIWSLRILEPLQYLVVDITTLSTIIHVASDGKYFDDIVSRQMAPTCQQHRELLELGEITLLLRRQETEALEERKDARTDRFEVVDLEVPHAVDPLPHHAATERLLEHVQDGALALRDVEAQRHLPGNYVVAPRTERDVETSLAVGKPCQVPTDDAWNGVDVEPSTRVFPADCPHP